ncbi:carbon dioxide-concentrating mechanism protein CcmK [Synechococcus sp. PCC 6717]|jgi:carbon dioxide concentrating mechanism protein CcmK|uniref:Carboxysome shell protein CcmK n=1 Tax=Parathermosynechococcus lividus PCC 6715 TaxID=1917166 RepID=A0A2D2Q1W3_PARLV|nr:carbon dioxide-concentrating mechanism protein CcmK [Thermostichus lividus]ATS18495.1 carbon dioxide-concentrating protein CcmK [Thermostichus lividus PCC 6715]MCH9055460.1 carbon dioxide-concentrating mechanism protein CcmK [Synechococcus sp. PCC 6716]MCI3280099.1 carbon dioxide-concentrating mechanism protein CcmK [Synechococcus sp. PCC 6717]
MPIAVGMVEVLGHPPALAVADVMVKAARVTLVGYERVSGARLTIIVRGDVSEVQIAVAAGVEAAKRIPAESPKEKTLYLSSTVIPRPDPNLEAIFPTMCFQFGDGWEQFLV